MDDVELATLLLASGRKEEGEQWADRGRQSFIKSAVFVTFQYIKELRTTSVDIFPMLLL